MQFHFAGRQRCRENAGKCDEPAEGTSNEGGSAGMTPTKNPFSTLANLHYFKKSILHSISSLNYPALMFSSA